MTEKILINIRKSKIRSSFVTTLLSGSDRYDLYNERIKISKEQYTKVFGETFKETYSKNYNPTYKKPDKCPYGLEKTGYNNNFPKIKKYKRKKKLK